MDFFNTVDLLGTATVAVSSAAVSSAPAPAPPVFISDEHFAQVVAMKHVAQEAINWADLPIGVVYYVKTIAPIKTNWGVQVILILMNNDGNEIKVWTPSNVSKELKSSTKLNAGATAVYIKSLGQKEMKTSTGGSVYEGIIHDEVMRVYGLDICEDKGLTNFDLNEYAKKLGIDNFRGVFMWDALPRKPLRYECGIVNLNTSHQAGSHWVCYFKDGTKRRIYFDSFGQITPMEIQKYLKTDRELVRNALVIQRNTDIVQHINTHVCGHLCLFVLTSLTREHLPFQAVLNELNDGYTQGNWKAATS